MPKWTDKQKARMRVVIDKFSVNDPMIVSEENWYALRENGMLDMSRTLVKTKAGLVVKVPFRRSSNPVEQN